MKFTTHRGYRYKIDKNRLTKAQLNQIRNQIGSRRYVWNKYVEWLEENPDAKDMDVPSYTTITKQMTWSKEIDSTIFDNVKRDFKKALKNHRSNPGHFAKPHKKKKRTAKKSFKTTCNNHSIWLRKSKLKIPKIDDPLPIIKHRNLPPGHKITSVMITEEPTGELFASVQFELVIEIHERSYISYDEMIGLDYSSPDFYVDDKGHSPDTPHAYRRVEERLSSAMSVRDRKQKRSKNKEKAKHDVACRYRDSANVRRDFTEKESAAIAKQHKLVFVEDLNLASVARSLKLGKSTHDNGFGMFRSQLAYKLGENGGVLVKVPRHFPSTKLCSHCGHRLDKIGLDEREWVCPVCGTRHKRDRNASVNLREFGLFALLCEGYVEAVVGASGEFFDLGKCFGVGSSSPDFVGLLCLAQGRLPVSVGGTPVVTYVVNVLKACLDVEKQRVVPACLTMDYVGAFITAKRNSVAAVTEAPTSAVRSAVSRG